MSEKEPVPDEGLSLREGTTDPDVVRRYSGTWFDAYVATLADWSHC